MINFPPSSTFNPSNFSTFERLTLASTYLYQKDERAMSGNHYSPLPIKCDVSLPSHLFLFSPLFVFKGVNRRVLKQGSKIKKLHGTQTEIWLRMVSRYKFAETRSQFICRQSGKTPTCLFR
jgi:hypothetical protein